MKLGAIDFHGWPTIVRNTVDNGTVPATVKTGEAITIYQIKDYDVVYQVSDKSGSSRYILDIDNKVSGKITGILPNKFAPTSVQIGGQSYQLGQYFDMTKLNSSEGSFGINDDVTLLLGYDGKVVDIISSVGEDNSNFAFVTGYSSTVSKDPANSGKELYTVRLLLIDGTKATYSVDTDPSGLKGMLVTYSMKDAQTVVLTALDYPTDTTVTTSDTTTTDTTSDTSYGEVNIKKDDGQIVDGSGNVSYAAQNIKIFNLIDNDGTDANVQLLNWSDLPSGLQQYGRVLYMNKTGDFGDVNVLLLKDVFNQYYKIGMVETLNQTTSKGRTTYSYDIYVGDQKYTYSSATPDVNLLKGTVVRFKVVNGTFNSLMEYMKPVVEKTTVQAVDMNRIKVDNAIYSFRDDRNIYLIDKTGGVSVIGTDDIVKGQIYADVAVYLDQPSAYGGKVVVLVLKEI